MYAGDPDPGIHGAAAWTLRQWGRQLEIQKIDRRFATGKVEGNRRWYVSRQGRALVVISPRGEFVVGSPCTEVGREDGPEGGVEMQRSVRIDYPFALATQQVTVEEFLRFRQDFYYRKYFSPDPSCPINNVSWYDAVAYCNWLNEQEGVPHDQWCYLPNTQGEYAQGMTIVGDFLRRTGYRLPTEVEWEYACRAGAITSRFYGESLDLDNHYVCGVQNALGRRTALVASFKPNDLGLFDMLGNNLEWTHGVFCDHSKMEEHRPENVPGVGQVVGDQPMRALRSASPCHPPETMRIAYNETYPSNANVLGTSLRIGRTCLPEERPAPAQEIRNDKRLALRGSGCFHCSEQMRVSYKSLHKVNFRLFAFGLRTARTISYDQEPSSDLQDSS
jgi:formylglycine-generating enzyme required for sulfatase activity